MESVVIDEAFVVFPVLPFEDSVSVANISIRFPLASVKGVEISCNGDILG